MTIEKLFPTIMCLLDLVAAGVYLVKGDLWMAWYWFSAACLTFAVTYRP